MPSLLGPSSGWIVGSSFNMSLFKNNLTKFTPEQLSSHFVRQFNSFLGKTHETPQELQHAYSYKSVISFTLNKEEFPPLLSVYSSLGSFTYSAKSSVLVRKSTEKTISQPDSHNSVTSRKWKTRIKI